MQRSVCTRVFVCVCVCDNDEDHSSPKKTAPCKGLLGLRLPIEHAAVICRVLQDLCIVGNSISHKITLPAQCVSCRVIIRLDSVQKTFSCIIRAKRRCFDQNSYSWPLTQLPLPAVLAFSRAQKKEATEGY